MERTGSCACGAIKFKTNAPVIATGVCHCSMCQKISGGGPNYVALIAKEALIVTQGTPAHYHVRGDSGEDVTRTFCANCCTPLWGAPDGQPFYAIKTGAFDTRDDLAPMMHIYVASAPAWHPIDQNLPAFPKMPPPMG